MVDRNGTKWHCEETILAFDLYCRTPFSKISQYNPEVIRLTKLLGRMSGLVGLKMHNLAHYDPELQKRNVSAMLHGSKHDEEIFAEFSKKLDRTFISSSNDNARMRNQDVSEIIDLGGIQQILVDEYRERMMRERIGQYFLGYQY